MDLTCIICSDSFVPNSEVYITNCGHMFHYACLIQWLERSKSCPQCRAKVVNKDLRKVYFSTGNSGNRYCNDGDDDDDDDKLTLRSKLENAKFEITLKAKDIKFYREQNEKVKSQAVQLREEIKKLEKEITVKDSVIHALKDQIHFFKSKSKEKDTLAEELTKAKNRVKELERVELIMQGSREEAYEMLKNVDDMGCLVTLSASLKKALVDVEKKKRLAEHKLKAHEIETAKYRKQNSDLSCENRELRKDYEMLRTKYDELRKICSPDIGKNIRVEFCPQETSEKTPSVSKKLLDTSKVESPYLLVKQSSSAFDVVEPMKTIKPKPPVPTNQMYKHLSIFRKAKSGLSNADSGKSDGILYNGLGGQSKEDVFPSPKTIVAGIKRHRFDSAVTSIKNRKMTDFMN